MKKVKEIYTKRGFMYSIASRLDRRSFSEKNEYFADNAAPSDKMDILIIEIGLLISLYSNLSLSNLFCQEFFLRN